jgi:lipoate-protein ligase A
MALDRELLHRGDGHFYLRFYDWCPPALSIGYHQRHIPDQWHDLCTQFHFDLVRRPSGGRAVLHYQTLTYALVCPQPRLDRPQTYQYLCGFLIEGLQALGIPVQWGQQKNYQFQPNCFATASPSDLVTANGHKLIGSAQVYHRGTVLQHGTIVIHRHQELLRQFFGTGVEIGSIDTFPQFHNQSLGTIQQKLIQQLGHSAATYFGVDFAYPRHAEELQFAF